jgi:hypothetical protein
MAIRNETNGRVIDGEHSSGSIIAQMLSDISGNTVITTATGEQELEALQRLTTQIDILSQRFDGEAIVDQLKKSNEYAKQVKEVYQQKGKGKPQGTSLSLSNIETAAKKTISQAVINALRHCGLCESAKRVGNDRRNIELHPGSIKELERSISHATMGGGGRKLPPVKVASGAGSRGAGGAGLTNSIDDLAALNFKYAAIFGTISKIRSAVSGLVDTLDISVTKIFKGVVKVPNTYIEEMRAITFETQGISQLNRGLEKDYYSLGKMAHTSGIEAEKMADLLLKNQRRGLTLEVHQGKLRQRTVKDTVRLTTTSAQASKMLGANADSMNEVFIGWNQQLGLSNNQLFSMGQHMQHIAKVTGVSGENLVQSLRGAQTVMDQFKSAGNLTSDAMKSVTQGMVAAQKYGVGDKMQEILTSMGGMNQWIASSPQMKMLQTDIAAGAGINPFEMRSGNLLRTQEGKKQYAQGFETAMKDRLKQMGLVVDNLADVESEFAKLPQAQRALINVQLKNRYGMDVGDVSRVALANQEMLKTPEDRMKEMTANAQKARAGGRIDEAKALEKEVEGLRASTNIQRMGEFQDMLKKSPNFNEALKQFNIEGAKQGRGPITVESMNQMNKEVLTSLRDQAKGVGKDFDTLAKERGTSADAIQKGLASASADEREMALGNVQEIQQQIQTLLKDQQDPVTAQRRALQDLNASIMDLTTTLRGEWMPDWLAPALTGIQVALWALEKAIQVIFLSKLASALGMGGGLIGKVAGVGGRVLGGAAALGGRAIGAAAGVGGKMLGGAARMIPAGAARFLGPAAGLASMGYGAYQGYQEGGVTGAMQGALAGDNSEYGFAGGVGMAALKGGATGASIGGYFGPQGAVAGALIGSLLGAAAEIGKRMSESWGDTLYGFGKWFVGSWRDEAQREKELDKKIAEQQERNKQFSKAQSDPTSVLHEQNKQEQKTIANIEKNFQDFQSSIATGKTDSLDKQAGTILSDISKNAAQFSTAELGNMKASIEAGYGQAGVKMSPETKALLDTVTNKIKVEEIRGRTASEAIDQIVREGGSVTDVEKVDKLKSELFEKGLKEAGLTDVVSATSKLTEEATKPGSIYVHDMTMEALFKSIFGGNGAKAGMQATGAFASGEPAEAMGVSLEKEMAEKSFGTDKPDMLLSVVSEIRDIIARRMGGNTLTESVANKVSSFSSKTGLTSMFNMATQPIRNAISNMMSTGAFANGEPNEAMGMSLTNDMSRLNLNNQDIKNTASQIGTGLFDNKNVHEAIAENVATNIAEITNKNKDLNNIFETVRTAIRDGVNETASYSPTFDDVTSSVNTHLSNAYESMISGDRSASVSTSLYTPEATEEFLERQRASVQAGSGTGIIPSMDDISSYLEDIKLQNFDIVNELKLIRHALTTPVAIGGSQEAPNIQGVDKTTVKNRSRQVIRGYWPHLQHPPSSESSVFTEGRSGG